MDHQDQKDLFFSPYELFVNYDTFINISIFQQNLMIMEQSEIIEYYPVNFKTDLNGKQQEWEAVVLIPFIDEVCLCKILVLFVCFFFFVFFFFWIKISFATYLIHVRNRITYNNQSVKAYSLFCLTGIY